MSKRRRTDRVCLFPDAVLNKLLPQGENVRLLTLPHPATGNDVKVVFCTDADGEKGSLYEIQRFEDKVPRSWFVGNSIQHAGELFICTPLDPVLMMLPLLQKTQGQPNFITIDQILDDKNPGFAQLENCAEIATDLGEVCDVRGEGAYCGFRLNQDLLLKWLAAKVERLATALDKTGTSLSSTGCESAMFSRPASKAQPSRTQRMRLAFGILSEYLPASVCNLLQGSMGLQPEAAPHVTQAPASSGPGKYAAAYAKNSQPAVKKTKKGTPSAVSRNLAKIDKSGMKSLASFFGKPKK